MGGKCLRCGSNLAPGVRVCPACGQAVRGGSLSGASAWVAGNAAAKFGLAVLGLLALILVLNRFGPGHETPAPALPPPAPVAAVPAPAVPVADSTDRRALADNVLRVIGLRYEFGVISKRPQPADPDWRTQMEQNARDLKAASDQGVQYTWPDEYGAAQTPYRAALTDYGYAADRWPSVFAGAAPAADAPPSDDVNQGDSSDDSAGSKPDAGPDTEADCVSHLQAGDASLDQALKALGLTTPKSLTPQKLRAKLDAPPVRRPASPGG